MPPILRAIILLAIGVGLQALVGLALLPALFDISQGTAATLTIVGVVFAGAFGFVMGLLGVYAIRPRSLWAFAIDVTWSAINTVTGLVFLIFCAIKGTRQPPTPVSEDRGAIWFTNAALGGAGATTIGTVMGGQWLTHETVHIQQARIFGPFYWPVYLVSYAANMLSRLITGRFQDPHWQAYGRVVMEDWAYNAAPRSEVLVAPSILWFALALLNALALGVLVADVPALGALPSLLGLGAIAWWIGLAALLAYALGRSFFPKASH